MMKATLILASASPRRKSILHDAGLSFKISPADILEKNSKKLKALTYVKELSRLKALTVAQKYKSSPAKTAVYILAADTIVVFKGTILEKPKNKAHALQMLRKLSGKTHTVYTAWTWILYSNKKTTLKTFALSTQVSFSKNNDAFWKKYIASGEPMDKAGAYAAQGGGLAFIENVVGSYSNVIGLPLPQVLSSFKFSFRKDALELFKRN